MNPCELQLDESPTVLSPRVQCIICHVGQHCAVVAHDGLTNDSLINWDWLHSNLPVPDNTYDYFLNSAEKLTPLLKAVEVQFDELHNSDLAQLYESYLEWTSAPQLLLECIDIAKKDSETGAVHSLLMSTAILERSLGDLYLLKGKHCPNMLKDLLITQELQDFLGDTAISLLKILIGPPISLNLRNVAWHGFFNPDELPRRYSLFMICVIASLGALLYEKQIKPKHRAFVQFPQVEKLSQIFPNHLDCDIIKRLFKESKFIANRRLPFWNLALQKYNENRFGESVALLLPQLEHSLRRVFAAVNNCPTRVLTAENTSLFTTLDEILKKELSDGTDNKLRLVIEDRSMVLLMDMFCYLEGPRLRDHFSHGEADIEHLPQYLVTHLLFICGVLCCQFLPHNSKLRDDCPVALLLTVTANYDSLFHPMAILKLQIRQVLQDLSMWLTLPRPSSKEMETKQSWEAEEDTNMEQSQVHQAAKVIIDKLNCSQLAVFIRLLIQPFGTVPSQLEDLLIKETISPYGVEISTAAVAYEKGNVERRYEEIVGLLRRIMTECLEVSKQVQAAVTTRYQQWMAKDLRSRQRNTYKRMIDSIPVLSKSLRLAVLIAICYLFTLNKSVERVRQHSSRNIQYLKFVLKCCENLHSGANINKNKWTEAEEIVSELVQKTQHLVI